MNEADMPQPTEEELEELACADARAEQLLGELWGRWADSIIEQIGDEPNSCVAGPLGSEGDSNGPAVQESRQV